MDPRHEELLRRLALHDEATVETLIPMESADASGVELGARTEALVRLASLIALQPAATSFEWAVTAAFAAGADDEEIVGVLLAVAPLVGAARASRAAADIATAIGYDLDL